MSKSAHVAVSTPPTNILEIFVRQLSEIKDRPFPEGCCLVTSLITLSCALKRFVRRGVEQQKRDISKMVLEQLDGQLREGFVKFNDRVDQLTDLVFRRLDAMKVEIDQHTSKVSETNRTLLLKDLVTNGLVSNVTKNANADAVAANAKTKPGGATLYRTVAPGSDDEDNSDSETKKTVVKKKVDRPRQIDTPVLNAREPPKKRGRPRKSPVHTEHIDDDDARPKNTGKKGGQGTDDTPKRTGTPEKKRGLPPKSPGRTDDTPNATGTPKKKRGRPRKNPENTDDTPETTGTPKKKRGRPRKNPEHTDDTPKKKQIRTDEIPR